MTKRPDELLTDNLVELSMEVESVLAKYKLPVPFTIYQEGESVVVELTSIKGVLLEPEIDFKINIPLVLSIPDSEKIIYDLVCRYRGVNNGQ